ncbi:MULTISPECIES: maleate cis-trans isomerase family protein [unclassified Streptomyces]|uniref:maleate cis-trans isomerase family protein n=1 Tax=unclassified Streptomyces TaxID=2593676 RepID=UPI003D72EFD6
MTALGFLYPGHAAEDDYPRMEQLLGSDVRVDLVHTDVTDDTDTAEEDRDTAGDDAVRRLGDPERLSAAAEQLRLAGAEAVVWASAEGSFRYGWEGAQRQVRALALAAGMPASSTSVGFAHAVAELRVRRVAVGATCPAEVADLFARFLRAADIEAVAVHAAGDRAPEQVAAWGREELLALARAADHPDAQALLLPDTGLRTAGHIPALEEALGKPVLTANQVTVREALRLTDRRVNAPELGALFRREPIVQV